MLNFGSGLVGVRLSERTGVVRVPARAQGLRLGSVRGSSSLKFWADPAWPLNLRGLAAKPTQVRFGSLRRPTPTFARPAGRGGAGGPVAAGDAGQEEGAADEGG